MEWRPIIGYEGFYEVSNTGLVRSVDRIIKSKDGSYKHLKGSLRKLTRTTQRGEAGYYVVSLRKNGSFLLAFVHILVAKAFIPNPQNLPTVNHVDGNKGNNNVWNLEWATYSDNNIHALATGLRKPRGTIVGQYNAQGILVNQYPSVCEAARQSGINRSLISHCVNGRVKSAGGFYWYKLGRCNDYLHTESTSENELPMEEQERPCAEDIVCTVGNNG